ncbi:MAG TPA: serine hydrolase [Vicinamibacterales bacterium]|nr:serine hydrolase [Vicinamibacterales bacterium]
MTPVSRSSILSDFPQCAPRRTAAATVMLAGWVALTAGLPAVQTPPLSPIESLDRDIEAGLYGYVDRLLVMRGTEVIADRRYQRDYAAVSRGRRSAIGCGEGCDDAAWMHPYNYFHPRWHPYYEGRDVHSLQSVTKSIAATVVGIAQARGAIRGFDRPFLEYFADRDLSKVDPRLKTATVEDVLTMRSGIEWHEGDRPLDDTNTTVQLEKSRDWIAFTLAQPMDAAPGTKWVYNSGGSMLLSGIVKAATGRFIDDYAREFLFEPLGIRDFHWKPTPTGHPDTEGGLYLSAHDLAKIGRLYLQRGRWEGRQILPESFVAAATTRHVSPAARGWDYGYQWWITRRGDHDIWAGRGFGGQLLIVVPSIDLVGVTLAWNVFPFDPARDGTRPRNLQTALIDALVN